MTDSTERKVAELIHALRDHYQLTTRQTRVTLNEWVNETDGDEACVKSFLCEMEENARELGLSTHMHSHPDGFEWVFTLTIFCNGHVVADLLEDLKRDHAECDAFNRMVGVSA